jgi:hypothetical protein
VARVLEPFIQHELAQKQLPAISVALVDDQQIVWAQGFGLADPDKKTAATARTIYRVGSVSKLFTDIGVMQLVERGGWSRRGPSRSTCRFNPKNLLETITFAPPMWIVRPCARAGGRPLFRSERADCCSDGRDQADYSRLCAHA